jgi:hypothetical protein
MTSIGGPGGIGGPKGPTGPDRPDAADDVSDVGADTGVERASAAVPTTELDAIAADIAAGRLSPREAVDRLVDQIAGTEQLPAADRAELRELLSDLVANDPYLAALVTRT